MRTCVMEVVEVTPETKALMCHGCNAVVFLMDAKYCPYCGAYVEDVAKSDGDVYEAAYRYAYDVGFDEGYEAGREDAAFERDKEGELTDG